MAKRVISEKTKAYRKNYLVKWREENKERLNNYASEYRKKKRGLKLGENRKGKLQQLIEEHKQFLNRKK